MLSRIQALKVDRIVHAGDLVGYGPNPNEVIDRVIGSGILSIKGNHDRAVVSRDFSWFNPYAAEAGKWTAKTLGGTYLKYLDGLREKEILTIGKTKIGLFHGSPDDPDEYVLDKSRALDLLRNSEYDVMICGHTHSPMHVSFEGKIFINPGSAGQPRDGDPHASFSILDLSSSLCQILRVGYDIAGVQREMRARGLPEILAARLSKGL